MTSSLGFIVMGLVSGLPIVNCSDSESFLVVHALYSQDGCQQEGFWEVVGHMMSPFDLSWTLLEPGVWSLTRSDHSPRARHPGMLSQVGLRKHHYKQSYWRWWNSSWAISNPKWRCCENAAVNMPAKLENSAVATGLEKVSFHSNPKERQCQRMLKLPHNCPRLRP